MTFSSVIPAEAGIQSATGWNLTYDAENRLISVAPQTPVDGATKIDYVYDYMSRRAQKKVSTYNSGSWSLTSSTSYIYDGWNLIREVSSQNNQSVSYVWGLDLSGSLQGAGGIGGLLARIKDGSVQNYTYDGNGNVSELVKADGSIASHYEYDPYGNTIAGSGDNPFRFSTKYLDAETGLYYYGYRYYSPMLGRWLNRDPIGELGGINVYNFVDNSPLFAVDKLGLWKKTGDKGQKRQKYIMTSSEDTLDTLADEVGLEASESYKWAKVEKSYSIGSPYNNTPCEVSVPNIWFSADLGSWTNPLTINFYAKIGMAVGRNLGTNVNLAVTGDYFVIKTRNARVLLGLIEDNIGDILGLSIYGHGGKNGYLGNDTGSNAINQRDIIAALSKGGYKIKEANLYPCYSGAEQLNYYLGTNWYEAIQYKDIGFPVNPDPLISMDINTDYFVDINWAKAWRSVARKGTLYLGEDWIFDTAIIGIK